MKKAGQIILTVITVIMGLSLLASLGALVLTTLLEVLAIMFAAGGEVLLNSFIGEMGGSSDTSLMLNMITLLASVWGLVIASILFAANVLALGISLVELVVCIIACVVAFKAKDKKGLTFPAIVSFILAGICFINGGLTPSNILFIIIYALPGVFFMTSKDEKKDIKDTKKVLEEANKEETKPEPVEAETVA